MQGSTRKVFQATLYEAVAVFFISPAISFVYDESLAYSTALSITISTVAMTWNILYNSIFELWESRQKNRDRTFIRRVIHSIGFEGGLTIILLPIISFWLNISLLSALATNIALFIFFFFYSFIFQWAFDKAFDVPNSAKEQPQEKQN